ncbi:hypothetical protein KAX75_06995 [candidate division WOR-3 bacterium]|nr:hypothetical protein [candidate division WOR-3 bacterium]
MIFLNKHGYKQTAKYFSNAKQLLKANKPESLSDSKNNCRKALTSLIKALTGKENAREAVKILFDQGII